jgi:elongation factor P
VRGDTVNNAMKMAKTETGFMVQVPMFVETGTKVKIDTRTGKYLERA